MKDDFYKLPLAVQHMILDLIEVWVSCREWTDAHRQCMADVTLTAIAALLEDHGITYRMQIEPGSRGPGSP